MKPLLRRVGLLLGLLKRPDAAGSRAAPPKSPEGRAAELWLLLGLRVVLMLLIVGFAVQTSSTFWRVLALVVFCLLAAGIGQQVRRLTQRSQR